MVVFASSFMSKSGVRNAAHVQNSIHLLSDMAKRYVRNRSLWDRAAFVGLDVGEWRSTSPRDLMSIKSVVQERKEELNALSVKERQALLDDLFRTAGGSLTHGVPVPNTCKAILKGNVAYISYGGQEVTVAADLNGLEL